MISGLKVFTMFVITILLILSLPTLLFSGKAYVDFVFKGKKFIDIKRGLYKSYLYLFIIVLLVVIYSCLKK